MNGWKYDWVGDLPREIYDALMKVLRGG